MKRYDVEVVRHDGQLECDIEPIACKNGPFVMYDAVEAELSRLRSALAAKDDRIEQLTADYDRLIPILAAKDAEIERLRNVLGRPELLENLAATEHERWSGWMKYQAEKTGKTHPVSGEVYEDRWKRQSQTAYAQLPEAERESDRIEARKTLAIIRAALANAAPEQTPETCVWASYTDQYDDDEDMYRWRTGCGTFHIKRYEDACKFCPYCGKRVEVRG